MCRAVPPDLSALSHLTPSQCSLLPSVPGDCKVRLVEFVRPDDKLACSPSPLTAHPSGPVLGCLSFKGNLEIVQPTQRSEGT